MKRVCPNCQTATYDDSRRLCYACLHQLGKSTNETSHAPESLDSVPIAAPPVGLNEPSDVVEESRRAAVLRYETLLRGERAARVELEDRLRRSEQTVALLKAKAEESRAADDRVERGDTGPPQGFVTGEPAAANNARRINRLLAGALALALATIVVQAVPHLFAGAPKVAALLSVAAKGDCPARIDPDGAPRTNATTFWIYEGRKATDDSDALDADRSITAACVTRMGSAITLQKATRVWRGSDPGQPRDFFPTERTLPPGATVKISGALSGLSVSNSDGKFLHYEVWAPIALP